MQTPIRALAIPEPWPLCRWGWSRLPCFFLGGAMSLGWDEMRRENMRWNSSLLFLADIYGLEDWKKLDFRLYADLLVSSQHPIHSAQSGLLQQADHPNWSIMAATHFTQGIRYSHGGSWITGCSHGFFCISLVGGFNQPLWKMMEFISWDDDIPNIWKVMKFHKIPWFQSPPTSLSSTSTYIPIIPYKIPWFQSSPTRSPSILSIPRGQGTQSDGNAR